MIRPLRRRHLFTIVLLGIVLVALYFAALAARPRAEDYLGEPSLAGESIPAEPGD